MSTSDTNNITIQVTEESPKIDISIEQENPDINIYIGENYGIGEAPIDGLPYVRKDTQWVLQGQSATFDTLDDTPDTKSGKALQFPRVNSSETALEYSDKVVQTDVENIFTEDQTIYNNSLIFLYDAVKTPPTNGSISIDAYNGISGLEDKDLVGTDPAFEFTFDYLRIMNGEKATGEIIVGDSTIFPLEAVTMYKDKLEFRIAEQGSDPDPDNNSNISIVRDPDTTGWVDYEQILQPKSGTIALTSDITGGELGLLIADGTPVNEQLPVFTSANTIKGHEKISVVTNSINIVADNGGFNAEDETTGNKFVYVEPEFIGAGNADCGFDYYDDGSGNPTFGLYNTLGGLTELVQYPNTNTIVVMLPPNAGTLATEEWVNDLFVPNPEECEDTLTVIDLTSVAGSFCNMSTASTETIFTIGDTVLGGYSNVLLDVTAMTDYPTVTGSNFIDDLGDFDTDWTALEMLVWNDGNQVNHVFLNR